MVINGQAFKTEWGGVVMINVGDRIREIRISKGMSGKYIVDKTRKQQNLVNIPRKKAC